MKTFNKEELRFIETLLEDELFRLNMRRNKSTNKKEFDDILGDRIAYIKLLLKEITFL